MDDDFLNLLAETAQEDEEPIETLNSLDIDDMGLFSVSDQMDKVVEPVVSSKDADQTDQDTSTEESNLAELLANLSQEKQIKLVHYFTEFQENRMKPEEFINNTRLILTAEQLNMLIPDAASLLKTSENFIQGQFNMTDGSGPVSEANAAKINQSATGPGRQQSRGDVNHQDSKRQLSPELQLPSKRSKTMQGFSEMGDTSTNQLDQVDVTKLDVDSMLDVTSYGGVNLKQEEAEILGSLDALNPTTDIDYDASVDRIRLQTFLNAQVLEKMISDIAHKFGLESIDQDFLSFISFACQERLMKLMEHMIIVSKHRTLLLHEHYLKQDKLELAQARLESTHETSIIDLQVKVKDDIKSILSQLERSEKEEEADLRRQRALDLGEQVDDTFSFLDSPFSKDETNKPKTLSDARKAMKNASKSMPVPDNVKAKLVNATALKAAGGTLKSWMMPDASKGSIGFKVASKAKTYPAAKAVSRTTFREPPIAVDSKSKIIDLCRKMTLKETRRVILKDALYCLEQDKTLRKSTMLYKWATFIK